MSQLHHPGAAPLPLNQPDESLLAPHMYKPMWTLQIESLFVAALLVGASGWTGGRLVRLRLWTSAGSASRHVTVAPLEGAGGDYR